MRWEDDTVAEPDADLTPEGEPIDTRTLWLTFPEGEVPLTVDLTKFNAAMRELEKLARKESPPPD